MKATLKRLKDIKSENCITLILNTHRTKPDYLKDGLRLKNLIKEAENRLLKMNDKREAEEMTRIANALAETIDHSHNLESLLLFVNVSEGVAEYLRLPIRVEDRVIIDSTFATRDLFRAMHAEAHYLTLVLSQEEARLIEVLNDKVVKEYSTPFPMENKQFFTKNKSGQSNSSRQTSLIAEFFNQIDKEVNKIRKTNKLPVLICTVEENYYEYLKIADEKDSIYDTYLNSNRNSDKSHTIAIETWKIIQDYLTRRNNAHKDELLKAVGENTFLSDTNEIWRAIEHGRIQTLFIETGLFQPVTIVDGKIIHVSEEERNDKNVVDDIYDDLIELNMDFGGDVVFLPAGELEDFNGFGAITRY